MDERELLAEAVKLLIDIKGRAHDTRRLQEPHDGLVTPSSKCLFNIEGDVAEFLNDLSFGRPDLAEGWEMGKEFADDCGIEWTPVSTRAAAIIEHGKNKEL